MKASQKRAQNRNENLEALERIAYRRSKIRTEETMSTKFLNPVDIRPLTDLYSRFLHFSPEYVFTVTDSSP